MSVSAVRSTAARTLPTTRCSASRLTSRELLNILRSFASLNLVGADIVEVAPAYDHAEITGVAASHAAFELISAMAPRTGSADA